MYLYLENGKTPKKLVFEGKSKHISMLKNDNQNPVSCRSQEHNIAYHLLSGAKITQKEAYEKFGCFRLASRISDLKQKGWIIQSRYIETSNNKRVKEYWL